MSQLLTCQQSASLIGVSKSTVKRLCDSGSLPSSRTPGGHRRVDQAVLKSWAAKQGIEMRCDTDLKDCLAAELTPAEVLGLMARGEGRELAERIAAATHTGKSLAVVLDEIVAPACWATGRHWEQQLLDPYEEHMRSRALSDALTHLRSELVDEEGCTLPSTASNLAIGSVLGGELHHQTSSMIELVMAQAGWMAHSLGAIMPVESLILAIERFSPRLVWVSYTCIDDIDEVIQDNHRLFSMLEPSQHLVIGGQALTHAVRRRLKYHFAGDSFCHLMSYINSLELLT